MAPIFGVVFFVSKCGSGTDGQQDLKLQFWPESLRAMLEYWYTKRGLLPVAVTQHNRVILLALEKFIPVNLFRFVLEIMWLLVGN